MRRRDNTDEPSGQRQFTVSTEILNAANITLEGLRHHFIELYEILGDRCNFLIPNEITDIGVLCSLIELEQRLQKLRQCDGFDEHIKTYTKSQARSSYFVTIVASFLVELADNLVLEPESNNKGKKADILLVCENLPAFLECKSIETDSLNFFEEHQSMFDILINYIAVPHQVDIQYNNRLSVEEIHRLGEALRERLPRVRGDGKIIVRRDLEVGVIKRDSFSDKRFVVTMNMTMQDTLTNHRYPCHVFTRNGITVSLSGPKVDYSKFLEDKIRKSRRQAPDSDPYVLVIDGNRMLGDTADNLRSVSSAFRPDINTRFSAAVIVNHHIDLRDMKIGFELNYVPNPFAKYPLSQNFERLFKERVQP